MSNSSETPQTPMQEAGERVAEAMPVMMFPRMVATVHQNHQRKAYSRRLEDDHRAAVALMQGKSVPDPSIEPEGEDDMGDSFRIAGDTTTHHHYLPPEPPAAPIAQQPAPAPQPARPVPEPQPEPAWKTWAKGAALAAAGAGLLGGYQQWNKPSDEQPPAIEQPAENPGGYLRYGVEVIPGPNRPNPDN